MPSSFYMPPRDELKYYAIDLDNTLAHAVWPDPGIGEPMMENIEKLIEVVEAGYKIIIYTARHWSDLEMIQAWLKEHNIPYKQVICGKPLVHRFVDDKAIPAEAESWL